MSDAEFLGRVPVLAGLSSEHLDRLATESTRIAIGAGEWLFREGERADSLFVVRSGRFEVVAEGSTETIIRTLQRGEVLGELALLQESVRSVSVRARRDGELLEVNRKSFEALVRDAPSFAVGLARALGAQLAASRTSTTSTASPRSLAVVGLDEGAPVRAVADLLAVELRRFGSVAELWDRPGASDPQLLLDRAEADADTVVLAGSSTSLDSGWTGTCIREAERVLVLSSGASSARSLERPEAVHGCTLVVIGRGADVTKFEALRPREVEVVESAAELPDRIAAVSRRFAGRSVGLALSGGGARAFAHLGVIEELESAGLAIDRIGAVSMGAIVGGAHACGFDPATTLEAFRETFGARSPSGDYTLPLFSLVRGGRARRGLDLLFGERRIEALPRRFFCVSCDLIGRELVRHRSGRLGEAVRASLSIPGVFPPVATADGRLLVDGGVLENLPVESMADGGAGPVIAVDVTDQRAGFRSLPPSGTARIGRQLRRLLTGDEAEIPRLDETLVRTLTVGSINTAAAAAQHADLVIRPNVEGVGMLDWSQLERVRQAGRLAAVKALEDAGSALHQKLVCGKTHI